MNVFRKKLSKWLLAGAVATVAIVIPVSSMAADTVRIEGTLGVANVTAGDQDYSQAVNAQTSQIVKVQVYYHNTESAGSNKNAQQLRVKLDVPTTAGKAQTIKANVKANNSNVVEQQVAVNLDSDSATLQYVPGTATWKHNNATSDAPNFVEEKISDDIVNGAQGIVLEDAKSDYAATVTVLARVMAPGVKVTKEVEVKGEQDKWSTTNTAKPGDTLKYLIGYQNTGNITQTKVMASDVMPAHVTFVPGSAVLTSTNNPNGLKLSDDIAKAGGVSIGDFAAGANAYVVFEATVDSADKLTCGSNDIRNTATVQPANMSAYTANAVTTVKRDCASNPTPTPPTGKPTPVFSCDTLTVDKTTDGTRKITARVSYTAKNGASFKTVSLDFGDKTEPLTTNKTSVDHTYTADGTYTVTATLLLSVNGKDQTNTSAACAKQVSFAAPTTPTSPTGSGLPNTGPGDVVAIFAGAVIVGGLFHRYFLSRRLAS